MFIAFLFGPGNSDEIVSGGIEVVPWYGLSTLGAAAAAVGWTLVGHHRSGRWPLSASALSLMAWTVFFLVIT